MYRERKVTMKRDAVEVVYDFVNLAACKYVSTLVQSSPLEFVKTLVVRLGPGEVLVVPACTHPSGSPSFDLFYSRSVFFVGGGGGGGGGTYWN